MIAYVTSKVEASENKPWRLGALAVCHNDKKLGKKEPFPSANPDCVGRSFLRQSLRCRRPGTTHGYPWGSFRTPAAFVAAGCTAVVRSMMI